MRPVIISQFTIIVVNYVKQKPSQTEKYFSQNANNVRQVLKFSWKRTSTTTSAKNTKLVKIISKRRLKH